MTITVILGAYKLVDGQCQEAQLCARAAVSTTGGANARRLVRFHLLPSGLINPKWYHSMNFIGSGVFFHELEEKGLTSEQQDAHSHISISGRISAIVVLATLFKQRGLMSAIGIGPCYQTSRARTGIKLTDVFYPELFGQKVRRLADGYQRRFGELFEYDIKAELARFNEYRKMLKKYVVDGVSFMRFAQQQSNTKIALMLDVDYGSYPFVTSSSTTLAGIISKLTLNLKNITETIGVVKACMSTTPRPGFELLPLTRLRERRLVANADVDGSLDVLDTFETIKITIAFHKHIIYK
ncbi:adenylosuccinate synthetase [Hypoxylon argillaceum]|nr:adenylosuccinate synthetase [Hypoxylon argillaceum]